MAGEVNVFVHVGPGQSLPGAPATSPTATTTPPGLGISSGSQPAPPGPTTSSTAPGVPPGRPTPPLPAAPTQVGHAPVLRPPVGRLPFTGLDALLLALVALCLIAAGTVSLLTSPLARRRARA